MEGIEVKEGMTVVMIEDVGVILDGEVGKIARHMPNKEGEFRVVFSGGVAVRLHPHSFEPHEEKKPDFPVHMEGRYALRRDPFTEVRVLCVDHNAENFPVVVAVEHGLISMKTEYGRNHKVGTSERDLVSLQVKKEPVECWALVDAEGDIAHLQASNQDMKQACKEMNSDPMTFKAPLRVVKLREVEE